MAAAGSESYKADTIQRGLQNVAVVLMAARPNHETNAASHEGCVQDRTPKKKGIMATLKITEKYPATLLPKFVHFLFRSKVSHHVLLIVRLSFAYRLGVAIIV